MMKYNVKVTPDAEKDLKAYLTYLYNVKRNPQAVKNVIEDFNETANMLSTVALSGTIIFFCIISELMM